MDTLIRRLHMQTGAGTPALPVTTDDPEDVRLEWFDIVVQTCGDAGVFFARTSSADGPRTRP